MNYVVSAAALAAAGVPAVAIASDSSCAATLPADCVSPELAALIVTRRQIWDRWGRVVETADDWESEGADLSAAERNAAARVVFFPSDRAADMRAKGHFIQGLIDEWGGFEDYAEAMIDFALGEQRDAPPLKRTDDELEDAKLLKLAESLPSIAREARVAFKAERRVLTQWNGAWPLAPDEITEPRGRYDDRLERGLTGAAVIRRGATDALRIKHTADSLDGQLSALRRTLRRRRKNPNAPINYLGEYRVRDDWAPRIE